MKSNTKKRLIAFMLCMVLVLSSAISAFADELPNSESKDQIETMTEPATEEATEGEPVVTSLDTSSEEQQPIADTQTEEAVQEEVQEQVETPAAENQEEAAPQVENETSEAENASQEEVPATEEQTANETQPILQLTYEDDNVKITVDAVDAGNIPDGASLSVTPIEKKKITDSMSDEEKETVKAINDKYDHTEKKLQEKAEDESYDIAGFLAYDITFVDADGNKLEPNGDVKVSMEYKKAEIPEAAKKIQEKNSNNQKLDVTVMHLEEDEKGEVKEVVDMVADENKTAEVETTEAKKVKKAEFVTDSFSVFTLTWNNWTNSEKKIKVVDTNGNEIGTDVTLNITATATLSEIAPSIDGYTFEKATYGNLQNEALYQVNANGSNNNWQFNTIANTSTWFTTWEQVYFVYRHNTGLYITNDIVNTGALQAEYIVSEGETSVSIISYTWCRSDSKDGTYTEVEKVNYQGNKSNISEDGSKLYPAFDNGAQKWYKVKVTLSDGTEVESSPLQVNYYNELKNGSFETPTVTGGYNNQWSNAYYASENGVWQTTGTTSDNRDIEIVLQGAAEGQSKYSWYGGADAWKSAAREGSQFAELNCEAAGALYQDVLTMEGTPLNYWLSHRARGKYDGNPDELQYDTMFLVIMPTSIAKSQKLNTQTNLEKYLSDLGVSYQTNGTQAESNKVYNNTETGVMVLKVTSSNHAWQDISKILDYTPTASLTRFFFMSGKTASGNPTVGNFLDRVGFSQELPPVADDEFSLQIKKEFNGLNSDEIASVKENLEFKITAKKGDQELTDAEVTNLFGSNIIYGRDMTSLADGSLVYTLSNRKIKKDNQYQVTITEENADLSGYSLDSTASTSVSEEGKETTNTNGSVINALKGKVTATVSFKNTYKSANYKNVNFKKIWDDNNNAFNTRPNSLSVTLHASIVVEENGITVQKDLPELSQTAELNADNNWSCTWNTPVYYNNNGTNVKIQYSVTEGELAGDYVYTSPSNGNSISGDGSNYTYTTFDNINDIYKANSSTQSLKKMLSANALSLFAAPSLQSANEDSGLGVPAHTKYINYNPTTSDYTLNLDVTGAKGNASGVDVLFVIDTSGSMGTGNSSTYTNLLPTVKKLLTEDNGIIDKILPAENTVNSVAYVSFAGKNETRTSSWYTATSKSSLKQSINSLRATGGTNWTYAMKKASEVLNQKSSSKNEKVVIFLSDGRPTYSLDKNNNQTGNGSSTYETYYTDAISQVTGSSSLSKAKIYSVYLTDNTQSGMKKFSDELINSNLVNGTNLTSALTKILNIVIPTYKNVTITDTLSEYVDFVETNPTISVVKSTASGSTPLTAGTDFTATVTGKTVNVSLLNGNSLEAGATYTVSFRVKPSDAANNYYAQNNNTYPHTGDAGTGSTSAGKEGFYSNDNDNTKLTYYIDGTDEKNKTASYPKPVVQVMKHTLTYEKIWQKPDQIADPTADVVLYITYTDGTTNTITLTKSNGYHATENVSVTKNIANITENTVDGYTPSYQITDNGTKATVTNSYSKITSKSITVTKHWEGNGPKSSIRVSLYQSSSNTPDPTVYGTAILDESNNWTYTWTDLPQAVGSGRDYTTYTYAVREENIPTNYTSNIVCDDYNADHAEVTITNTYDPNCADESYYIANVLQTEQLTINKIWDDNDNSLNKRPSELKVTVNNSTFKLTKGESWTNTVTIPKKKTPASYTATENLPNNSEYEQVGSAIINTTSSGTEITFQNKLKTTSLTVHKEWNDGNPEDRPDSISFRVLYRIKNSSNEYQLYGNYSLTEEDSGLDGTSWTKVIETLPAIYEYKVEEITGTGSNYRSEVTSSDNNYTITNTLKWSAIKTSENWNADDTDPIVKLQGAEFELKDSSNNVIATGISGEDGKITWTVEENVNLETLNGTYTISETKAPDGYILHENGWALTFTNGLLTNFDGNDIKGTAETGVVITLTNKKVYSLPSTGGTGIYLYMIGGMMLMLIAVWILYKNKCREVLER